MLQELSQEKVKPYLKLLTEACVHLNCNQGSLRKDIWDYLYKKYANAIDYRDFLLAIRRFFNDGKLINNDGYYQMHPEVIVEVREKTPTPVFKKTVEGKPIEPNMFLKFLKKGQNGAVNGVKGDAAGSSKRKGKKLVASKISGIGKKQKVKPVKESTRQSKIQKYFIKKQMQSSDFIEFHKQDEQVSNGLGFATPTFNGKFITPPKNVEKEPPSHQKKRDRTSQSSLKKEALDYHLTNVTKGIFKRKKPTYQELYNAMKQEAKTAKQKQPKTEEDEETVKREKERKKQVLKEKKEKVETKGKAKLKGSVIKALKEAVSKKNLQTRKKFTATEKKTEDKELVEIQKEQSKKVVPKSEKSKGIKKFTKADRKRRALNQLKTSQGSKIYQRRLRGKTLDLTQLGIIKQKKPQVEEDVRGREKHASQTTKKEKSRQKSVKVEKTHKQAKSVSIQPKRERSTSVRSETLSKSSRKETPKKYQSAKKTKSAQIQAKSPKESSRKAKKERTQSKKSRLQSLSRKLTFERKAKIDAAKTLKQLFSKDKQKDEIFMDGKLIYL